MKKRKSTLVPLLRSEQALREAALAWSKALGLTPRYVDDRDFRKIDRKLQRAARRYSECYTEAKRDGYV